MPGRNRRSQNSGGSGDGSSSPSTVQSEAASSTMPDWQLQPPQLDLPDTGPPARGNSERADRRFASMSDLDRYHLNPELLSAAAAIANGGGGSSSRLRRTGSSVVMTVQEESEELRGANEVLARYMKYMQEQEAENVRLKAILSDQARTRTRHVNEVKGQYQSELDSLRADLTRTRQERIANQVELDSGRSRNLEMRDRLRRKLAARQTAERKIADRESEIQTLKEAINEVNDQEADHRGKIGELKREIKNLDKDENDNRSQLNQATLERESLQQEVAAVVAQRDEAVINFERIREDVTNESAQHLNESRIAAEELIAQYRRQMTTDLDAVKIQNEDQLADFVLQKEHNTQAEIDGLRDQLDRANLTHDTAWGQLNALRKENAHLESSVGEQLARQASLEGERTSVQATLREFRVAAAQELQDRAEEAERLRGQSIQVSKDAQTLSETKMQLTIEIAAFRKMLASEEERLSRAGSAVSFSSPNGH